MNTLLSVLIITLLLVITAAAAAARAATFNICGPDNKLILQNHNFAESTFQNLSSSCRVSISGGTAKSLLFITKNTISPRSISIKNLTCLSSSSSGSGSNTYCITFQGASRGADIEIDHVHMTLLPQTTGSLFGPDCGIVRFSHSVSQARKITITRLRVISRGRISTSGSVLFYFVRFAQTVTGSTTTAPDSPQSSLLSFTANIWNVSLLESRAGIVQVVGLAAGGDVRDFGQITVLDNIFAGELAGSSTTQLFVMLAERELSCTKSFSLINNQVRSRIRSNESTAQAVLLHVSQAVATKELSINRFETTDFFLVSGVRARLAAALLHDVVVETLSVLDVKFRGTVLQEQSKSGQNRKFPAQKHPFGIHVLGVGALDTEKVCRRSIPWSTRALQVSGADVNLRYESSASAAADSQVSVLALRNGTKTKTGDLEMTVKGCRVRGSFTTSGGGNLQLTLLVVMKTTQPQTAGPIALSENTIDPTLATTSTNNGSISVAVAAFASSVAGQHGGRPSLTFDVQGSSIRGKYALLGSKTQTEASSPTGRRNICLSILSLPRGASIRGFGSIIDAPSAAFVNATVEHPSKILSSREILAPICLFSTGGGSSSSSSTTTAAPSDHSNTHATTPAPQPKTGTNHRSLVLGVGLFSFALAVVLAFVIYSKMRQQHEQQQQQLSQHDDDELPREEESAAQPGPREDQPQQRRERSSLSDGGVAMGELNVASMNNNDAPDAGQEHDGLLTGEEE